MFSDIQWVVQKNLTNHNDLVAINNACGRAEVGIIEVDIVPFSSALPDLTVPGRAYFTALRLF